MHGPFNYFYLEMLYFDDYIKHSIFYDILNYAVTSSNNKNDTKSYIFIGSRRSDVLGSFLNINILILYKRTTYITFNHNPYYYDTHDIIL